jgi:hypothetical protein
MMTDNFIFCGKGKENLKKESLAIESRLRRGRESRVFGAQNGKTRPGGQPDGSSHMGAWGGWALAPNTAVGEG